MMRISTTTLESFRLYMNPEQDWMEESELLATIHGEFVPTHKTELGQAFGEIVEKPERGDFDGEAYTHRGYSFPEDVIETALALFDRRGAFEAKVTKQYGDFMVVAKADHAYGATLNEIKVTLDSFDFDKYAASCQWRFYLDMFGAERLRYHVFCVSDPAASIDIKLRSIESFDLYPYPGLRRDCDTLLREFRRYVKLRGLEGLLRQRQTEAEERGVIA